MKGTQEAIKIDGMKVVGYYCEEVADRCQKGEHHYLTVHSVKRLGLIPVEQYISSEELIKIQDITTKEQVIVIPKYCVEREIKGAKGKDRGELCKNWYNVILSQRQLMAAKGSNISFYNKLAIMEELKELLPNKRIKGKVPIDYYSLKDFSKQYLVDLEVLVALLEKACVLWVIQTRPDKGIWINKLYDSWFIGWAEDLKDSLQIEYVELTEEGKRGLKALCHAHDLIK